jgi:hypothetical protein
LIRLNAWPDISCLRRYRSIFTGLYRTDSGADRSYENRQPV